MSPQLLTILSLVLFAAALALAGISLLMRASRQTRSQRTVNTAITAREQPEMADALARAASPSTKGRVKALFDGTAEIGKRWGEGRIGNQLLAGEDRELLDRCGFKDPARARAQFVFARAVLALGLPLASWLALSDGSLVKDAFLILVGFSIGYMLPKWVLKSVASTRVTKAAQELPLLIDLLRLLQGVGLSIDQSLHVIVTEFRTVIPVLASELEISINQYARGLGREQSLQRLATGFANDDLGAIARLIVQVDKHGGAVQEPLKQFAERVREQRRMQLKERVGKLTVKMTGVMVLTLLPALIIVTAGAGFLAVFRSLASMGGL